MLKQCTSLVCVNIADFPWNRLQVGPDNEFEIFAPASHTLLQTGTKKEAEEACGGYSIPYVAFHNQIVAHFLNHAGAVKPNIWFFGCQGGKACKLNATGAVATGPAVFLCQRHGEAFSALTRV